MRPVSSIILNHGASITLSTLIYHPTRLRKRFRPGFTLRTFVPQWLSTTRFRPLLLAFSDPLQGFPGPPLTTVVLERS